MLQGTTHTKKVSVSCVVRIKIHTLPLGQEVYQCLVLWRMQHSLHVKINSQQLRIINNLLGVIIVGPMKGIFFTIKTIVHGPYQAPPRTYMI